MNANELAEAMEIRASIRRTATSRKSVQENANDRLADQLDQAATMLRQQQALINQRQDEIKAFYNLVVEQDKKIIDLAFEKVYAERSAEVVAELYTHPVKELTDEEIKFIAYPFESVYTTYDKQTDTDTVHTRFDKLGFARAILRKAQEK